MKLLGDLQYEKYKLFFDVYNMTDYNWYATYPCWSFLRLTYVEFLQCIL